MTKLMAETESAINKVSIKEWQSYCNHVTKLESTYWKSDAVLEELSESLTIVFFPESDDTVLKQRNLQ